MGEKDTTPKPFVPPLMFCSLRHCFHCLVLPRTKVGARFQVSLDGPYPFQAVPYSHSPGIVE